MFPVPIPLTFDLTRDHPDPLSMRRSALVAFTWLSNPFSPAASSFRKVWSIEPEMARMSLSTDWSAAVSNCVSLQKAWLLSRKEENTDKKLPRYRRLRFSPFPRSHVSASIFWNTSRWK